MSTDADRVQTIDHPAPHKHRVPAWLIAFGLGAAPLAWFVELNASYWLAASGCAGHGIQIRWAAIGGACAVVALLALMSAANAWQLSSNEAGGGGSVAINRGHGRTRFLSLCGLIVSVIFLTSILFLDLVPGELAACG